MDYEKASQMEQYSGRHWVDLRALDLVVHWVFSMDFDLASEMELR
jgi:hypothetical protein